MQFFPAPSPQYWAPAEFNRLEENGSLKVFKFDCHFVRVDEKRRKELDAELAAARDKDPALDREAFLLARVCKGWRIERLAADGATLAVEEFPYSDETAKAIEAESTGFIATCMRAFYLSNVPSQAAHYAEKN